MNEIKKSSIPHVIICTSPKNLSKERAENFDFLIHYLDVEGLIKINKNKIGKKDFDKLKIYSNKKVVCGDKIYNSFFELNSRKNLDHFYLDLEFFRVYTEKDEW